MNPTQKSALEKLQTALKQADYEVHQSYEAYRRSILLQSQIKAALDLLEACWGRDLEPDDEVRRLPESIL